MDTCQQPRRLGNRVREKRRALGLTQAVLAQRVGVARQTVNEIERQSSRRQVTHTVALRLATVLETDVRDLFYELEEAS
jgi:DNA-binding XRE family transcriptional regulator